MEFQNRLYELRKKAGLSQEGLADLLGVTRQAVQKWEAGSSRPDMDNLAALARYFNVTLDYLVTGREPEPYAQEVPTTIINHNYYPRWHYEYKSQRTLFGLPLVHVRLGDRGFGVAKGIFAVGNVAVGLFAPGRHLPGTVQLGRGLPGPAAGPGRDVRGRHRHWGLCGGTGRPGRRGHRPAVRGRRLLRRLRSGRRGVGTQIAIGGSASAPLAIGSQAASGALTFGPGADPAAVTAAIRQAAAAAPCMAPGPAHLPRPGSLTLVFPRRPWYHGLKSTGLGSPSPGTGAAYDTDLRADGGLAGGDRRGIPPDAFFEELDGGIQLEEAALPDPDFPPVRCTSWGNTAMICWAGTSSYTTAPLPPCSRRRTRRVEG